MSISSYSCSSKEEEEEEEDEDEEDLSFTVFIPFPLPIEKFPGLGIVIVGIVDVVKDAAADAAADAAMEDDKADGLPRSPLIPTAYRLHPRVKICPS